MTDRARTQSGLALSVFAAILACGICLKVLAASDTPTPDLPYTHIIKHDGMDYATNEAPTVTVDGGFLHVTFTDNEGRAVEVWTPDSVVVEGE